MMPTKFHSFDMKSDVTQLEPQHMILGLDDTRPNHEMTDLTAENDHILLQNDEPFNRDDIDFSDGQMPGVPKAITETDEGVDENDGRPYSTGPGARIDDGLLPNGGHDVTDHYPTNPSSRRPSFGFPGYSGTGFVEINGVETALPDLNVYQHKKTLAQGMMDLALLSANANQLRYVLEYAGLPYYYPSLIFISISIIFQMAVGVGLILNSQYNIKDEKDRCRANKINNYTVIGIFIVTVVNVFISAFGVADDPSGST